MNSQEALLAITVGICLVLATVAFSQGRGAKSNIQFGFMTLAGGIWALVTFFEEEKISFFIKPFLVKLDFTLAFVISILFYFFSIKFSEDKYISKFNKIFLVINAIILFITPTNLIISNVIELSDGSIDLENGSLFLVYAIALGVNFLLGTTALIRGYFQSSGIKKKQLLVVSVGLFTTITISLITNIVIPQFMDVSPLFTRLGIYSMIVYLTLTTYAITQHGLFNIKVIATQLFVGLLLFAILGRILTSNNLTDFVYETVLFALSLVFGFFLVRSVNSEIFRRKEIEELAKEKIETLKELEQRNKSLAALQRVSDIVLNELDMKQMAQKILDEIPQQLDNCVGAFLSIVRGGHLVAYSVSTNTFTRKVYSLVGEDLEKYSYPIKKEFNGLHAVLAEKRMVEGDKLDQFICPPISRPVAKTLQTLVGAKHMVALPLYASGEPLGVMMFVYKTDKQHLHEKDLEIAKAIADDMSLAIQRAQAFQKLKDANEYLSQLDKMKDEFISMASHELNTPLAAIEGYLSMILDEGLGKVDAKSKEYLSRAYASSKRLAELILDLLNVSRIEQGRLKMKFSQVSLAELAESVIHELQIKADTKKIYLKVDAEKELPKLWCDPDRIREVIVNLTGNALKFTDQGGVTIKINKSEGEYLRVSVVDTGRGIAKEDQKKLFQKFSQVKREIDEHQGTGLGLYISKNFVELHNGKLWVESDAGKGATFIFELPILKKAPLEVDGAILEKPISEPQIEVGTKEVPKIITDSSKVKA